MGGAIAPGSGAEARAGTAGKETSVGEGQGVAHPQLLVELRFTQVLSRDYGYVLCSAKWAAEQRRFSGILLTRCEHCFEVPSLVPAYAWPDDRMPSNVFLSILGTAPAAYVTPDTPAEDAASVMPEVISRAAKPGSEVPVYFNDSVDDKTSGENRNRIRKPILLQIMMYFRPETQSTARTNPCGANKQNNSLKTRPPTRSACSCQIYVARRPRPSSSPMLS